MELKLSAIQTLEPSRIDFINGTHQNIVRARTACVNCQLLQLEAARNETRDSHGGFITRFLILAHDFLNIASEEREGKKNKQKQTGDQFWKS